MIREIALTFPGGKDPIEIKPVGGMPSGGIGKLEDVVQFGISFLLVGATFLALAFLIWGGIQWITSGGDKAGIETARKKITFAVIGLVVVFSAFFIINVVSAFFGIKLIR